MERIGKRILLSPLILTFSLQGRRDIFAPSPSRGEGWGEGAI
jgi:hypothetical protein